MTTEANIHHACNTNHVSVLKEMLAVNASLADTPAQYDHIPACVTRPIHHARSPEVVDILVAHGARVCAVDGEIWSPLATALLRGDTKVATRLAELDPSIVLPAMRTPTGDHILHHLARTQHDITSYHGLMFSSLLLRSIVWIAKQPCVDVYSVDPHYEQSLVDEMRKDHPFACHLLNKIACARADRDGTALPSEPRVEIKTDEDSDDSESETEIPPLRGAAALDLLDVQIEEFIEANMHSRLWRLGGVCLPIKPWPVSCLAMPIWKPEMLRVLFQVIIQAFSVGDVHTITQLLANEELVSRINTRVPNMVFMCIMTPFKGKRYEGINAIEVAVKRCLRYHFEKSILDIPKPVEAQIFDVLISKGASVDCGLAHAIRNCCVVAARYLHAHGGKFTNDKGVRQRTPLGALLSCKRENDSEDGVLATLKFVAEELGPIDVDALTETRHNGEQESVVQTFQRMKAFNLFRDKTPSFASGVADCLIACRKKFRLAQTHAHH